MSGAASGSPRINKKGSRWSHQKKQIHNSTLKSSGDEVGNQNAIFVVRDGNPFFKGWNEDGEDKLTLVV